MDKVRAEWTGVAPYMQHNARLANSRDEIAKQMKKITAKRTKTEEDHEVLAWLEFQGGIYFDEQMGVYVPVDHIEGCITKAAMSLRQGPLVKSGLQFMELGYPLIYTGPRTIAALYDDANFVEVRPVRVKSNRVMRTRPIFRKWSVEFFAEFDTELINFDDLTRWMEIAGRTVGIGELRPRFGRFTTEIERI